MNSAYIKLLLLPPTLKFGSKIWEEFLESSYGGDDAHFNNQSGTGILALYLLIDLKAFYSAQNNAKLCWITRLQSSESSKILGSGCWSTIQHIRPIVSETILPITLQVLIGRTSHSRLSYISVVLFAKSCHRSKFQICFEEIPQINIETWRRGKY
jgi:hypothetical protein